MLEHLNPSDWDDPPESKKMQITVKKIFEPFNASDESGAFIGTDDNKYYLDIKSHRMLVEGLTIEAEATKTFSKKTGKPYYNIKGGFDPVTEGQSPSAKADFVRANVARLPDAKPFTGVATSARIVDTKSLEMFVMGVVGRAMGSGKFDTQDIPLLTAAAVEAWNTHMKGMQ